MKIKRFFKNLLFCVPFLGTILSVTSCTNSNESENIKSFELCEQLNTFIKDIKLDGTLKEIESTWLGSDDSKKVIDYSSTGENGTITFASVLSFEPMGYISSDGKKLGFSTDIVYRFAKRYGYSVQILDSLSHADAVTAVSSRKADFGGTCMAITEERRQNGCFSDPFYENKIVVLTSFDTKLKYSSLEELDGLKFGVATGSTYTQYCNEKFPNSQVLEYTTNMDAAKDLNDGKIQGIVIDKPIADLIINKAFFNNVTYFGELGFADDFAFYFPKFVEQSLSYYDGKRIGTVTGSADEVYIREKLPNAKIYYYDSFVDCASALASGKIDAYADETSSFLYIKDQVDLKIARIPGNLADCYYGYVLPNDVTHKLLRDDFNVFLASLKARGKLDELIDKWLYHYESAQVEVNYTELTGADTIFAQTTALYPPFTYIKDGELAGLEVEILALYAKDRGKKLNIEINSLGGILTGVELGVFDIGFTTMTYSQERAEKMLFTDSHFDYNIFLVASVGQIKENFFKKVANSFESTFVKENRWKLFLNGFLTTLLITVLSIIIGSILGLLAYLLVRNSKVGQKIFKICDYIITGMPVVVLLMIVYYLLFAKSTIGPTYISIGVFSLIFMMGVIKALFVSVGSINKNQTEAYLALGYKNIVGFFRFIIPQATKPFLAIYKTNVVELLKATSIVGYISIQDLTKMSDIIRSRSYEAFFPLITLAILYFGISFLLIFIIERIEILATKRHRKQKFNFKGTK